ncbi:S-adenosyl-L-methionine-dependent methyltransferase [Gigaspora rosea]|uniref:S-adenosyl-L-methionine-dependent methyltransferase n=1 Tax=Gigaspora rosea TaxID=44941 RepID=A0A397U4C6_9GLOM|nr:S-adenosyl-L-methionine-dependent methyltransferase [Gigaspora rosea]
MDKYQDISNINFSVEEFRYPFPSGKSEINRSEVQHGIIKYVWQGNFSADMDEKLKKGIRTLDIGCGYGSWISDMAQTYPLSTFIGIDIVSRYFPKDTLPNAGYLECNILNGLPFPDETFDFVYQRFLWSSLTEEQWTFIIGEIVRVTKKGGAIELMEFEMKLTNSGPKTALLFDVSEKFFALKGVNPHIISKIPIMLQSTGKLSNIQCKQETIPLGWGGKLGELALRNLKSGFAAGKSKLMQLMNKSSEECDALINALDKEAEEYKTCMKHVRIFCKKD